MPYFRHPIPGFPIGNLALSSHRPAGLRHHPHAWLDPSEIANLAATLIDGNGTPLAWPGREPDLSNTTPATRSFLIVHPWDFLLANEFHLAAMASDDIRGEVHPLAVIDGRVRIGPGTRILPGVYLEGNVVIGANCKIGPNCHIRGATSIGDHCHIGNAVEIKNSIILSHSNVGHLSYVGDSVLGENVNLGAGTITSNLRHDGKTHRSLADGVMTDTGRRKFGTIIGDGVRTGIHTAIYPARKLAPGATTLPGQIVDTDI